VTEAPKVFTGAIAFVDPRDLKPGMALKLVRIEEHMPSEEGYPLH
jgi:hypothetical protein